MKHIPKKDFGQNFLMDKRIQQRIVQSCQLNNTDVVVEIGSGQGAITRLLAPHVKQLVCIEKDKDLIEGLQAEFSNQNVTIIEADFLKLDLTTLGSSLKIIGNIPYNISTPIVEKLIENKQNIEQAFMTVQFEFGQRMSAKPGSKDYGALSCFVQYHADVKMLFNIKSSCFHPKPQVDSCFVHLDFSRAKKYLPNDEPLMFRYIRTVFTQRRKNILNASLTMANKEKMTEILNHLKLPLNIRPEGLSLQNFVDISNSI